MTTTTDKGLTDEELLAIVDQATPGEWQYRTGMPYDWGWVTNADGHFIAQMKDPRANDAQTLDAHRAAKTDPWRANAVFATTFDPPMVRALIERARAAETRALAMEEALKLVRPIQHAVPVGRTLDEMQNNVRATELYAAGDTLLVWVNEGDWLLAMAAAEAARALSTEAQS